MIEHVVLLTTAVLGPGGRHAYRDMFDSVESAAASASPAMTFHVVCLFQGASARQEQEILGALPANVEALFTQQRVGTAVARNTLLRHLADAYPERLNDAAIVAVPDDDVVLAPNLLPILADLFTRDPALDLVLVETAPTVSPWSGACEPDPVSTYRFVRSATSNTAYFRGRLLQEARLFDVRLGPGTPTEGGEDSEFLIGLARRSRRYASLPAVLVGHRPETMEHTARYYMGSTLALRAHLDWNAAIKFVFARKLLVGIYFVMSRRMAARTFLGTVRRCLAWNRETAAARSA